MQDLIINNKFISIENPIEVIKLLAKLSPSHKLSSIKETSAGIQITCPEHADGHEHRPSCYINTKSEKAPYLWVHCFTCGISYSFDKLVASVLEVPLIEAQEWLIERYGNVYYREDLNFPAWSIEETKVKPNYLDESILDQYRYYHPYVEQRKIPFEIAKKFLIGYNQAKNTITFPVWDEKNNLVMITERAIDTKKFYIPEGVEKPVYLLNYVLKENYKTVILCESQFNVLTCWSYGLPAVGLFGTGTEAQYEILKKSGITNFILCFDGDSAGRKGARRFIKNMPKNVFITDIIMPEGKDVNDLEKEEFLNLLRNNNILV